ncbi:MAG: hypothetical protein ACLTXL_02060 [Clostridia bacterium]
MQARAAFADHLIDGEGRISDSSQNRLCTGLALDLFPWEAGGRHIKFKRKWSGLKEGWRQGLLNAASPASPARSGIDDMAYRVLLRRDAPSRLYPVRMGSHDGLGAVGWIHGRKGIRGQRHEFL